MVRVHTDLCGRVSLPGDLSVAVLAEEEPLVHAAVGGVEELIAEAALETPLVPAVVPGEQGLCLVNCDTAVRAHALFGLEPKGVGNHLGPFRLPIMRVSHAPHRFKLKNKGCEE